MQKLGAVLHREFFTPDREETVGLDTVPCNSGYASQAKTTPTVDTYICNYFYSTLKLSSCPLLSPEESRYRRTDIQS